MTTMNPVPRSAGTYEARRVTARVAMIGIPIAILQAAVIEFFRLKPAMQSSVGIIGGVETVSYYGLINDRTAVIAVGLLALIVCGIIILVRRSLADIAWSVGGVAVLCAAVAGYFWTASLGAGLWTRLGEDADIFVTTLWTVAAIAVTVALYRRGLWLNASIIHESRREFTGYIWKRGGIFAGIGCVVLLVASLAFGPGSDARAVLEYLVSRFLYMGAPLGIVPVYIVLSMCEKAAYDRRTVGAGRLIGNGDRVLFYLAAGASVLNGVMTMVGYALQESGTVNYGDWQLIDAAVSGLVSLITLMAMLRLIMMLGMVSGKHALVRAGVILYGAEIAVAYVMTMIQNVSLTILHTYSYIYLDGMEAYATVSAVMSYVNLVLTIIGVVALVLVALGLRCEAGNLIFALPVLYALPSALSLVVMPIASQLAEVTVVTVVSLAMQMVTALMVAARYVVIPSALSRVQMTGGGTERQSADARDARPEDFLTEI